MTRKSRGQSPSPHLRFGAKPINATYLIGDNEAGFVACHQPIFLGRYEMLEKAAPGATFLLNSQADPDQVWQTLPPQMQKQMIEKQLSFYVIDAYKIAAETGMGRRINTIMQTCFFSISGLLESDRAIDLIKAAVKKSLRPQRGAPAATEFRCHRYSTGRSAQG